MSENITKGVHALGNSFYIKWEQLDEMFDDWAKKEFGSVIRFAVGERDETDCSVYVAHETPVDEQQFIREFNKHAQEKGWLQEEENAAEWQEEMALILDHTKLTTTELPCFFTPFIVGAIVGKEARHAVATYHGVYFFEKEREGL